ncbi:MAG: ATP-binding protein [Turneriella sp.]|nr:ATP-binding protein [Turneriella sp.]
MAEVHVAQRARIAAELEFHDQLNAALAAHGEWKFRLSRGIEQGCPGLDPEKIRADNQCVFGKWLYSEKVEPYRKDPHYEKIRQLHANFHREAAGVVELCLAGKTEDAKQALEGRYLEISTQLADAIRAWIRELLVGKGGQQKESAEVQQKVASVARRYALRGMFIGIISGFGFVIWSLGMIFLQYGWELSLENLLATHTKSWSQWVVDCAPFVLGGVGYFLGHYFGIGKTENLRLEQAVMQRTAELLASQREMKLMRDNLSDGVFFIGSDRRIGPEYSAALRKIFEQEDPAGFTLLDIFRGRIDETTERELAGYLDLMFDKSHSEDMLAPLNPFNPLVLHEMAGIDEKIIRVTFKRILNQQGQIAGLLGVAVDITKQVKAEREAERQRALSEQKMVLVGRILEIGPQMLALFRNQVESALNRVSDLLQQAGGKDLRAVVAEIYRHIHTIKGSASLLKIDNIAHAAHSYEEELSRLQKKPDLGATDFIGLSVRHAELSAETQRFQELLDRIRNFQAAEKHSADEKSLLIELLQRATEAAAKASGKEIGFVAEGFDTINLAPELFEPLRACLIQLVRNSAAHGIETPAEREAQGKPRQGRVTLSAQQHNGTLKLIYHDDGAGLNAEKIKARAIERGLINPMEAEQLTTEQIYKLIFRPGFSTAESEDMAAGRGVGMDIVLSEIKKIGGKLAMRSQPGQGIEFIFTLPVNACQSTEK